MSLYIRLLGPVRLYRQGRAVTLTAIKQLSLLAALALSGGQPLDLSDLTDAVWAEDPPRSAVANLRNYASALRQGVGDRLSTVAGGYRLTVASDEVDVFRFRAAVDTGRRLAGPDPARAERALVDALALWHGDVGQGLPAGTSLEAEWTTLRTERLTAFEDLVDVRLRRGRHDAVVPALHTHLRRHPLRERAWGQLMLALYRGGDTASALRAYTAARAATREHLGIDPGAPLGDLQRQILRRSPSLDLPRRGATVATSTRWMPPRHRLPTESGMFAGRRAEVSELLRRARSGDHVALVVHGPAGLGKSTLVQHAARRLLDDFPDGVAYLDNHWSPPESPAGGATDLLGRALRALGAPAADLRRADERAEALRDLLAGHRMLLIADNVVRADQVRHLTPPDSGSVLLVTSRSSLPTLDHAHRMELAPASERDALAILSAYAGPARVAAAPGPAGRIAALCDHLPLALRIVGTQLAQRPSRPLDLAAERLADPAHRLDALEHHDLSVRQRLASAYATVEPSAAELFRALPGLPEQVSPHAAARATGLPAARAWSALDTLADAGLVVADDDDRYHLSGLPRCFGAELAAGHPGRH